MVSFDVERTRILR